MRALAQDSEEETPRGLRMSALGSLLPFLWPSGQWRMRLRVIVALVFLGAAKIANVYVPLLYKRAVDHLSADIVVSLPIALVGGYALLRVTSLAFAELRDAVFAKVAQRAVRDIGLTVFRHLHSLSLRFHLDRQTGGLSRSIERGTAAIQTLLTFALFNILPTLLEIGLVTVILWRMFDARFALVTLATVITYITYTVAVTSWRLRFRRVMNEQDSEANTRAIDSLLNFETVKYFTNEEHEAQRFDGALRAYEKAAVKSQSSLALLNIGQSVIISVGLTAILWLAGQGIVDGQLGIGDFVLVNTYLLQLYQPLGFFGFVYREIKQSLVDIEKMFSLLGQNRDVDDAADAPALAVDGAHVRFEGVRFGYDARRLILQDIDFEILPGQTVAVVGPSGSGKSTLGRLLFRFYDVDGGRLCIDGQDLREVTQRSVRAAIGIVPQDTVLFNDTIYYNIAYGRPSATPSEVEAAARVAELHDFIQQLPDGYQSRVGERGLKLSGGEKQRVAIARTVLKDPAILIFDEATSALDSGTEKLIQHNLGKVSEGRTTLVIAHRLSTIVDANQILVLEGGQIVERGKHSELLAAGGPYHTLWERQRRSEAEAAEGRDTADVGDPT